MNKCADKQPLERLTFKGFENRFSTLLISPLKQ